MGKKDLLKSVLCEAEVYRPKSKFCVTCAMPKEFHEILEEVTKLVSEGKSKASVNWLHRKVQEHFDYPYQNTTFRRHMEVCRPDLYKFWRKAR